MDFPLSTLPTTATRISIGKFSLSQTCRSKIYRLQCEMSENFVSMPPESHKERKQAQRSVSTKKVTSRCGRARAKLSSIDPVTLIEFGPFLPLLRYPQALCEAESNSNHSTVPGPCAPRCLANLGVRPRASLARSRRRRLQARKWPSTSEMGGEEAVRAQSFGWFLSGLPPPGPLRVSI